MEMAIDDFLLSFNIQRINRDTYQIVSVSGYLGSDAFQYGKGTAQAMDANGIAGAHNQIFGLTTFSKTMITPETIILPGSALHPQTSKRRLNVHMAVVSVLAFHVVLLGGLLIQGCNHQEKIRSG